MKKNKAKRSDKITHNVPITHQCTHCTKKRNTGQNLKPQRITVASYSVDLDKLDNFFKKLEERQKQKEEKRLERKLRIHEECYWAVWFVILVLAGYGLAEIIKNLTL